MEQQKKKLLFVLYGLGIGGIEKAMVNLLNVLPEERYDIDMLVIDPLYDMVPQIRRKVRFLDNFVYTLNTEFTMQEIRRRGGLWAHREKLLPYLEHRIRIKLGLPTWVKFRSPETRYDIAVAYSQNGLGPYYLMDKVQADRKVLWYHNGAYERTGKEYEQDRRYYPKFDQVVAVSSDCAAILKEKFPELRDKLLVLRNFCDADSIRRNAQSGRPDTFEEGRNHIVTVGRLSKEKGMELALEACRQLCREGRNICWHWIGDSEQRTGLQQKIDEMGLRDRFILEGSKTNPYPYILHADVYVQPSYYEAYSTTVTEARVLCRPVVATDVGGMRDQLPLKIAALCCSQLQNAISFRALITV